MSSTKLAIQLIVATAALLLGVTVAAETNVRIGELSSLDQQYMAQQRDLLQELATTKLGRRFNGDKHNDLPILQLLLDRRLVRADQTRELQAMGVIMGDLLAANLDMHWVIYQDGHGRSRALRYQESDEYLFPITMISRRREADNHTPVTEIYQKAYDIIAPLQPPRPFQ
jgi:Domain of unknown function (DUF3806)